MICADLTTVHRVQQRCISAPSQLLVLICCHSRIKMTFIDSWPKLMMHLNHLCVLFNNKAWWFKLWSKCFWLIFFLHFFLFLSPTCLFVCLFLYRCQLSLPFHSFDASFWQLHWEIHLYIFLRNSVSFKSCWRGIIKRTERKARKVKEREWWRECWHGFFKITCLWNRQGKRKSVCALEKGNK